MQGDLDPPEHRQSGDFACRVGDKRVLAIVYVSAACRCPAASHQERGGSSSFSPPQSTTRRRSTLSSRTRYTLMLSGRCQITHDDNANACRDPTKWPKARGVSRIASFADIFRGLALVPEISLGDKGIRTRGKMGPRRPIYRKITNFAFELQKNVSNKVNDEWSTV